MLMSAISDASLVMVLVPLLASYYISIPALLIRIAAPLSQTVLPGRPTGYRSDCESSARSPMPRFDARRVTFSMSFSSPQALKRVCTAAGVSELTKPKSQRWGNGKAPS